MFPQFWFAYSDVLHGRGVYQVLCLSATVPYIHIYPGTLDTHRIKFWNICQVDSGYHETPNVLTKHVISRITLQDPLQVIMHNPLLEATLEQQPSVTLKVPNQGKLMSSQNTVCSFFHHRNSAIRHADPLRIGQDCQIFYCDSAMAVMPTIGRTINLFHRSAVILWNKFFVSYITGWGSAKPCDIKMLAKWQVIERFSQHKH